jgi:hypothetical protein
VGTKAREGRSKRGCEAGPAAGELESGQASVELVAAIPALLLVALVAAQMAFAGYALWSAGVAARAGARADYVGGSAVRAARASLPGPLRSGASVDAGNPIAVRVRVPSLVPGLPRIPLTARAGFGVGDAPSG